MPNAKAKWPRELNVPDAPPVEVDPHAAPSDVELALRERVKELDCLYTIARLQEQHWPAVDRFLQAVADRLPASFRLPEQASARILAGRRSFTSAGFEESAHRIAGPIRLDGQTVGQVEVFYREADAPADQDVFLPEEYPLIEAVADRVAGVLKQMRAERELRDAHQALQCERDTLEQTNIALRTVLNRLEDDKRQIRASLLNNIQKIIMPIVLELELQVTGRHRAYAQLLRRNLEQIADPFLSDLAKSHTQLSPVELAVATMIRNGLSTKEIAELRCISPATVRRHRENIRRKLGLNHRKVNLATYLQAHHADPTADDATTPPDRSTDPTPAPSPLDELW